MKLAVILAVLSLTAASVVAQDAPKEPPKPPTLMQGVQSLYQSVERNLVEAADLMPEENYAFKPTPEVRSFGQMVAHAAQSQYFFCSAALGVANPNKAELESLKTKKELVEALKQSNAFCEPAYAPGAASTLEAPVTFGKRQVTKGYVLVFNVAHGSEHYGNLVTYLRLKGLVPPSTARNAHPPAPAPK